MKRTLPLFTMIIMISLSSSAWSQVGFRFSQKFQHRQAALPVQSADQISGYRPPVVSPPEGTYLPDAKFPQVHYTLNRVARFRAGSRNAALSVSPVPSQQQAIFTPFHYPAGVGPTMSAVPLPTTNPSFDVDRSSFARNDFDLAVESECPLAMPTLSGEPFQSYETDSAPIAITPPFPGQERIRQLLPPPVPERVQKVVPEFSPQTQSIARAKFANFSRKNDNTPVRPTIVLQEEEEQPIVAPETARPLLPLKIEGPVLPEVPSKEPEQVTGTVDWPNGDEIVTTEDNPFEVDDVFGDSLDDENDSEEHAGVESVEETDESPFEFDDVFGGSLDGENDSAEPTEAEPIGEIEDDPFAALFGDEIE